MLLTTLRWRFLLVVALDGLMVEWVHYTAYTGNDEKIILQNVYVSTGKCACAAQSSKADGSQQHRRSCAGGLLASPRASASDTEATVGACHA